MVEHHHLDTTMCSALQRHILCYFSQIHSWLAINSIYMNYRKYTPTSLRAFFRMSKRCFGIRSFAKFTARRIISFAYSLAFRIADKQTVIDLSLLAVCGLFVYMNIVRRFPIKWLLNYMKSNEPRRQLLFTCSSYFKQWTIWVTHLLSSK